MSRMSEVAKALGCTESDVCYLLRKGRIEGTCTSDGWVVTDDAIHEYLKSLTPVHPQKFQFYTGQQFGYWKILGPKIERNKNGGRVVLCQCCCGAIKYVLVESLVRGRSKSCGCRRAENQNQRQLEGRNQGQMIMKRIHQEGLAVRYMDKQVNRNSKTGYTGVCWRKKEHKYFAYIMVDRKRISLGLHTNLSDAVAARKAAEDQYFRSRQEKVDAIKQKSTK